MAYDAWYLAPFKKRSWYGSLTMLLIAQSWTEQLYGMVEGM
jgi:hypothetical protein